MCIRDSLRLGAKKGPVPETDYLVPLGKAAVVREGKDVTLIAIAWICLLYTSCADRRLRDRLRTQ